MVESGWIYRYSLLGYGEKSFRNYPADLRFNKQQFSRERPRDLRPVSHRESAENFEL